jgi:hypothetical protein
VLSRRTQSRIPGVLVRTEAHANCNEAEWIVTSAPKRVSSLDPASLLRLPPCTFRSVHLSRSTLSILFSSSRAIGKCAPQMAEIGGLNPEFGLIAFLRAMLLPELERALLYLAHLCLRSYPSSRLQVVTISAAG